MIRINVNCDSPCQKTFEGMFPDKKSFREQKEKGLIICPLCDGKLLRFTKINKDTKVLSANK